MTSSAKPSTKGSKWKTSAERAELLSIYAEADRLVEGWSCACATATPAGAPEARCCHFGVTGREPYPTAVELEEVCHALLAASVTPRKPRSLPLADARPCPLLSDTGRCRIYASRPFGCRTFFCDDAEPPVLGPRKRPRDDLAALGRRIADLSARFAPRDPHPRPLVRALVPATRRTGRGA
ncbi:MAG: hypothetical protein ACRENE_32815 [Polyangiaceae bacterium]